MKKGPAPPPPDHRQALLNRARDRVRRKLDAGDPDALDELQRLLATEKTLAALDVVEPGTTVNVSWFKPEKR